MEEFHLSKLSTSAIEILNLDCNLPSKLFITCLFSFKELDSNICTSIKQVPTINLNPPKKI